MHKNIHGCGFWHKFADWSGTSCVRVAEGLADGTEACSRRCAQIKKPPFERTILSNGGTGLNFATRCESGYFFSLVISAALELPNCMPGLLNLTSLW